MKNKDTPKKKPRGAPAKNESEKVGNNGFKVAQNEKLAQLAAERRTSIAAIKREAVDWYLLSLEEPEKEEAEKIKA